MILTAQFVRLSKDAVQMRLLMAATGRERIPQRLRHVLKTMLNFYGTLVEKRFKALATWYRMRPLPACKIKEGYGLIGGKDGWIVGSLSECPRIKIVLIGTELHYVNEDHIEPEDHTAVERESKEEQRPSSWTKRLLRCLGAFICFGQRGANNGD